MQCILIFSECESCFAEHSRLLYSKLKQKNLIPYRHKRKHPGILSCWVPLGSVQHPSSSTAPHRRRRAGNIAQPTLCNFHVQYHFISTTVSLQPKQKQLHCSPTAHRHCSPPHASHPIPRSLRFVSALGSSSNIQSQPFRIFVACHLGLFA